MQKVHYWNECALLRESQVKTFMDSLFFNERDVHLSTRQSQCFALIDPYVWELSESENNTKFSPLISKNMMRGKYLLG